MTLCEALCFLIPELTTDDFMMGRVVLQNDGDGDYIRSWLHTAPRPSDAQIAAAMAGPRLPTAAEIKAECARRIYAKASDNAQKNMLANFAAGTLTAEEQKAFKDGTAWIRSMQMTARGLIAKNDPDFLADAKWPTCPANAEALAKEF